MFRRNNRSFVFIAYGFFALFLLLAIYYVYFVGFAGESFINNSYNPRISEFSKMVIRGDILSSDGSVLATTEIEGDGSEKRVYPKGAQYAHAIGYTSKGLAGAELWANFHLLRSHSFFVDKIQREMKGEKNQGDSVVTTLDTRLMDVAYQAMAPYQGAVVAIDPESGQILAMVSKPDFDPNSLDQNWDYYTSEQTASSVLLNRATQGLYPPGSTLKILTALEYLREGGTLSDEFDCTGRFTKGTTSIHCYHGAVHGHQTLEEAFGNSCNCVFSEIGLSLDKIEFSQVMRRAMFNRSLPTSLSPVAKSSFSLENVDEGEMMLTSIGQGKTLVTPLHMAMITASIANDGLLMEPYMLMKVLNDGQTTIKTFHPKERGVMFEKKENNKLKEMMRFAVTDGTVSGVSSDRYDAYGKTGTAEYSETEDLAHSWFVGFADNGEKKLAIAVVLERAGSGSEHAVPFAKALFDAYF